MWQVRRGFIQKVYSILMVQLVLTGAIVAVFCLVQPIRLWIRQNGWIVYVFTGVVLVRNFEVAVVCLLLQPKESVTCIILGLLDFHELLPKRETQDSDELHFLRHFYRCVNTLSL